MDTSRYEEVNLHAVLCDLWECVCVIGGSVCGGGGEWEVVVVVVT